MKETTLASPVIAPASVVLTGESVISPNAPARRLTFAETKQLLANQFRAQQMLRLRITTRENALDAPFLAELIREDELAE